MENQEKIALVISALISCALATGLLGTALSATQTSRVITNAGSVKGVGVGAYWDSACTNKISSISWGSLDACSNKTIMVYVRNEGNTGVTLSIAEQNWNPSTASSYMTLKWNYLGQTLSVNQVIPAKLTLTVSSAASGTTNFGFDLTVTASGQQPLKTFFFFLTFAAQCFEEMISPPRFFNNI